MINLSLTLGGALSSFLFGGAAAIGSAVNPVVTRVFVEPEVLRVFTAAGAPWLIGYTYDDIAMEEDFCAASLDTEPESLYVKAELTACLKTGDEEAALAAKLLELGLTVGEASTISAALGTPHDRVILLREEAREMARRLGLNPTSPVGVLVDAFQKDVITLEEFVRLFGLFTEDSSSGGAVE